MKWSGKVVLTSYVNEYFLTSGCEYLTAVILS